MAMTFSFLTAIGVAGLILSASSAQATAIALPNQVFDFTGTCTDCTGTATAELTLAGSYTPGSTVQSLQFVSFHYDGTNLQSPFTITSPATITGGVASSLPGASDFSVANSLFLFSTHADGTWSVASAATQAPADYGTAGNFAATAPEPASILLGLPALGAFVLMRRRKNAVR